MTDLESRSRRQLEWKCCMPTPILPKQDEASFSSCGLKASLSPGFKALGYYVGRESAFLFGPVFGADGIF